MSSEPRTRAPLAFAIAFALAAAGCADFSRGPVAAAAPDAGASADGGDAADGNGATSFAADVEPLLIPTCQACHAAGAEAGDTRLLLTGNAATDYPTVMAFVDPSSPGSSRLLSKMSGNGHQGGAVYAAGSPEYLTVRRWIEQGAPP